MALEPGNNNILGKIISLTQIVTFIVMAIYTVANTRAATDELKETVLMLRDDYKNMSERLIKLETRFDDSQRRSNER